MDLYARTSALVSEIFTKHYSTSFSSASTLFDSSTRRHIYAIYGLVRIADEIVDTYTGDDQAKLLNDFEQETYAALIRGFSTNPLVQAFVDTARAHDINKVLLKPFFDSMRMDISAQTHRLESYRAYIYGSAEVVGLMCLKVFCKDNPKQFKALAAGAQRLGAAYQKVNFLRDVAADYQNLGRFYFPDLTFETLDETAKCRIIADIKEDFAAAEPYIAALPRRAQKAVRLSYEYYNALLIELDKTPIEDIKQSRIRVPGHKKLQLLLLAKSGKTI